jgi:hypothetical protein
MLRPFREGKEQRERSRTGRLSDPVFRQRPGRSAVSSWPGSPAEARAGGREQGAATCIAAGGWAAQEALNAFRLDGMADG